MAEAPIEAKARARRRAKNKLEEHDRLDLEIRVYQLNRWNAETAKIARLKALRMARDVAISAAQSAAKPKTRREKRQT